MRVARRQRGAQHVVPSAFDARDEDEHRTSRDRLCHWRPALGVRQRERRLLRHHEPRHGPRGRFSPRTLELGWARRPPLQQAGPSSKVGHGRAEVRDPGAGSLSERACGSLKTFSRGTRHGTLVHGCFKFGWHRLRPLIPPPNLKFAWRATGAACPQRRELWLLATQHLPSELRVLGHGRCRAQAASLRVTRLSTAFKPHRDPRG